jgi:maltooligosyltrehalose trehalohydrolase
MQAQLPDPTDPQVFASCKLDFSERSRHHETYALHQDLLRLRRAHAAFSQQARGVDGAVLGNRAFVLRFFAPDGKDRLLLINLGIDTMLGPVSEPLLAPQPGTTWQVLWSSENPRYGGTGALPVENESGWLIIGKSAVVLADCSE